LFCGRGRSSPGYGRTWHKDRHLKGVEGVVRSDNVGVTL